VSISDGNTTVEFDQSNALDGNAAAGPFSVALGLDPSMIDIVCAECGHQAPFAEERGDHARRHVAESVRVGVLAVADIRRIVMPN
jgi:hypothetical protein